MDDNPNELISSSDLIEIRKTVEETRKALSETFRFYVFLNIILIVLTIFSGMTITYFSLNFVDRDFRAYSAIIMIGLLFFSLFLNYVAQAEMRIFSYRSKALQTALVEFSRYQRKLNILEYEWKLLGDFRIDSSRHWLSGLHTKVFSFFPALNFLLLLIFVLDISGFTHPIK